LLPIGESNSLGAPFKSMNKKGINQTSVSRSICLGKENLSFTIHYRKRKTIGISIKPDCSILVNAPLRTQPTVIESILEKRYSWIHKQIQYFKNIGTVYTNKPYSEGSTFPILGRLYKVRTDFSSTETVSFNKEGVHLKVLQYSQINKKVQNAKIEILLEKWYRRNANRYLINRFSKIFHRLNRIKKFPDTQVSTRKMKRRWGSCCSSTCEHRLRNCP